MRSAKGQLNRPIPYLIKDYFSSWPSFTKVLYCSLDYENVILFIMLFNLFDRVTGSSIIAVTIVYFVEKVLSTIRAYLSKGNIAKKTLVDERFFV
jgi:hypothetical protein